RLSGLAEHFLGQRFGIGRGGGAAVHLKLHENGVEPAAEFVARPDEIARMAEARRLVQAHRSMVIRAIADHGEHLAKAQARAFGNEGIEQLPADAPPLRGGIDIDRVLHDEPIGAARPEWTGIGIAEDAAVLFGHEVRVAPGDECFIPPGHLFAARRLEFVARTSLSHGVAVDCCYRIYLRRSSGPERDFAHSSTLFWTI